MKKTPLRILAVTQSLVLIVLMFLTLGNEIIDLPQYIFDDIPTLYSQRFGEMNIELLISFSAAIIQIFVFRKLYYRIRVLEGFSPESCTQENHYKKFLSLLGNEHSLLYLSDTARNALHG